MIFYNFSNICRKHSGLIKIWQEKWSIYTQTLTMVTRFFLEWEIFQTKCVEKIKTHFVFSPYSPAPPETDAFYEIMWNMWKGQTGHRWQYNMAHALGTLDNWGKNKDTQHLTVTAFPRQHNTENFNYRGRCSTSLMINPLKLELNSIFYLLALLGAHHFLHVSRIRVKSLTFRRLMSYTGWFRRNLQYFGKW